MTGGRAYVGTEATRAAVVAGGDAFLLHIATHASQASGEAAFLLRDGTLPTNEIVAQRIAPRLAVIATCRSQVDDDPAGSLVAAFLAAGASGVVGVKRSLDDNDGAALMADLYRLHGAEDPVRALALAQRAAIAANRPPGAWATVSFFGVGGWVWH
jgi:CHAT domain-containing protein